MSGYQPSAYALKIRQQPEEALVTLAGKEKSRKPVDPPPIIQLSSGHRTDLPLDTLQNPYLFISASLFKADEDGPYGKDGDTALTGALVSSLHRLKDVNDKDGGFFIFGDMSVKVQGTFRIHFSLYELRGGEVQYLTCVNSDKFKVLPAKDFKGMGESTYLSRAFSDQGVRLRLRKEPRGINNKRGYPSDSITNTPIRPDHRGQYSPSEKRSKVEQEDKDDNFPASTYPQEPPRLPTAYDPRHFSGFSQTPGYGVPMAGTHPGSAYGMPAPATHNSYFRHVAGSASASYSNPASQGAVSNPLAQPTSPDYLNLYPHQYDQRNVASSEVHHSNYNQQFPNVNFPHFANLPQ